MKKILQLLIVLTMLNLSHGQVKDTLYLDTNYKELSKGDFLKRLRSNLFYIAHVENDSVFYRKLRYRQYFGKLDGLKKHQFNKLFRKRYEIDTTKVWLIHYVDTLYWRYKKPSVHRPTFLDSVCYRDLKSIMSDGKFKKFVNNSDRRTVKRTERKRKSSKFKNMELIHFYNFNKGYPVKEIEYGRWFEDHNLLVKKTFSDGIRNYKSIILFPNGNFCLDPWPYEVKDLLTEKSFLKAKEIWLKAHSEGTYHPKKSRRRYSTRKRIKYRSYQPNRN